MFGYSLDDYGNYFNRFILLPDCFYQADQSRFGNLINKSIGLIMKHNHKAKKDEELEILGHDSVPGYKTAFYIAVAISVIYLILAFSTGGGGGH